MSKKYWYSIALIGEDVTEGLVQLTEEEAAIVKHAADPDNWDLGRKTNYSGRLVIDIDNPIEID